MRTANPICPYGPQFNLSHSGDLILLAMHPHHRVGVDVEQIRPELDWQPIAERMFTRPQRESLEQLPAAEQRADLLIQWCTLEAELKATGSGLAGLERHRHSSADEVTPSLRR